MRRLAIIILSIGVTACTPEQHQAWLSWFSVDPDGAVAFVEAGCGDLDCEVQPVADAGWTDRSSSEADSDIGWGQCSQWMGDALDAGWTTGQWSTLNWIMARESNCQPGAYNPSGASGLLQLMPFWAGECGGSPGDLFSPWFNLSCGLHVYHQQGWGAWDVID